MSSQWLTEISLFNDALISRAYDAAKTNPVVKALLDKIESTGKSKGYLVFSNYLNEIQNLSNKQELQIGVLKNEFFSEVNGGNSGAEKTTQARDVLIGFIHEESKGKVILAKDSANFILIADPSVDLHEIVKKATDKFLKTENLSALGIQNKITKDKAFAFDIGSLPKGSTIEEITVRVNEIKYEATPTKLKAHTAKNNIPLESPKASSLGFDLKSIESATGDVVGQTKELLAAFDKDKNTFAAALKKYFSKDVTFQSLLLDEHQRINTIPKFSNENVNVLNETGVRTWLEQNGSTPEAKRGIFGVFLDLSGIGARNSRLGMKNVDAQCYSDYLMYLRNNVVDQLKDINDVLILEGKKPLGKFELVTAVPGGDEITVMIKFHDKADIEMMEKGEYQKLFTQAEVFAREKINSMPIKITKKDLESVWSKPEDAKKAWEKLIKDVTGKEGTEFIKNSSGEIVGVQTPPKNIDILYTKIKNIPKTLAAWVDLSSDVQLQKVSALIPEDPKNPQIKAKKVAAYMDLLKILKNEAGVMIDTEGTLKLQWEKLSFEVYETMEKHKDILGLDKTEAGGKGIIFQRSKIVAPNDKLMPYLDGSCHLVDDHNKATGKKSNLISHDVANKYAHDTTPQSHHPSGVQKPPMDHAPVKNAVPGAKTPAGHAIKTVQDLEKMPMNSSVEVQGDFTIETEKGPVKSKKMTITKSVIGGAGGFLVGFATSEAGSLYYGFKKEQLQGKGLGDSLNSAVMHAVSNYGIKGIVTDSIFAGLTALAGKSAVLSRIVAGVSSVFAPLAIYATVRGVKIGARKAEFVSNPVNKLRITELASQKTAVLEPNVRFEADKISDTHLSLLYMASKNKALVEKNFPSSSQYGNLKNEFLKVCAEVEKTGDLIHLRDYFLFEGGTRNQEGLLKDFLHQLRKPTVDMKTFPNLKDHPKLNYFVSNSLVTPDGKIKDTSLDDYYSKEIYEAVKKGDEKTATNLIKDRVVAMSGKSDYLKSVTGLPDVGVKDSAGNQLYAKVLLQSLKGYWAKQSNMQITAADAKLAIDNYAQSNPKLDSLYTRPESMEHWD